jgi:type II secretory pathway pseudopilin PulG
MIKSNNHGFTLIELLTVITIFILIIAVVMPNLVNFKTKQSLKNTNENIVALLNKAKSDSLSSLNSSNYGIHFNNDNMVYFAGEVFSEGDSNNQVFAFEPGVEIPEVGGLDLNGGGDNIIFPRLTGDTIGYGIITIRLITDPTIQKVITIEKTGAISSN